MNDETQFPIEVNGLKFRVAIEADDCKGPPWNEQDGHGPVSDWTSRDKRPGERVLNHDGRSYRYYDWAEAVRIAKRDGWGIGDAARTELVRALGREPTQREVAAAAVEADFARLRAWCNDEWYWVGVVVTLLDVDGDDTGERESCWGIESDSPDYHAEVAHDLAEQIAREIGDVTTLPGPRIRAEPA
jgi:hypothetical protein